MVERDVKPSWSWGLCVTDAVGNSSGEGGAYDDGRLAILPLIRSGAEDKVHHGRH